MHHPFFTVSLDFELYWGVKDKRSLTAYGNNILGARLAVPAMLALFRQYQVRATWATVGLLTFSTKAQMLNHLPDVKAAFANSRLVLENLLEDVGADEGTDPYHFGYSLVRAIQQTEGMEVASHTFGHFNCLEPGATAQAFAADLQSASAAFDRLGLHPVSLVFPRNQYDAASLRVAHEAGMRAFRGNPLHALYEPQAQSHESALKRGGRLLDAYANVAGSLSSVPVMNDPLLNVPASRFLRPWSHRLNILEDLRLARICNSMSAAAVSGQGFHLWWHPHNFGTHLQANLAVLERLLRHFAMLRDTQGMRSMTMADVLACQSAVSGSTPANDGIRGSAV